ncbi:hypothetical protein HD806DRAFT_513072 [Xylariaceae sp. AK1471]|nr:hypothetical protein HD806DRAFT_513072 [Xylariaceae sp. AK1471]
MASTTRVTISRRDLQENIIPEATITDVKPLASYSWIEAATPTIAVPGIPPRWSPPTLPRQLPKDTGLVYIAQNAARHPSSPLEPLFRALYTTAPTFDIRTVDVVSDRNNIRKLLSFVNPSSSRNGLEPFTIDIETNGNTVIFSRAETKTKEYIGAHEFKGYGHEFEKAYTTSDISDSTGHHRIVSYRFCGLNFIIRHEVDGYVKDQAALRPGSGAPAQLPKPRTWANHSAVTTRPATSAPTASSQTAASSTQGTETAGSSLTDLLGALSLGAPPKTSTPTGSKMAIRQEGHSVPLNSTLEIKTRVAHKPISISDVAPQLWVSQTPKLVRAYHQRGTFPVPQVEDVTVEIRAWEQQHQTSLKKLAVLIKKILDVARGRDKFGNGSAVVKYDSVADSLVVTKSLVVGGGQKMLPRDLYLKWEDKDKTRKASISSSRFIE